MNLIVLSGKARAGKDTFGGILAEKMYEIKGKQFIIMAYAYELKVKVQKDFDLSWDQLWGDEKEIPDERYPKLDGNGFWTPREILQEYGQFYRTIDKDFWVKHLFSVIEDKNYNNVIITDGRHINEISEVHKRGGYHIKVYRDIKSNIHNPNHISEIALDKDGIKVDFEVYNNGGFEDLHAMAEDIINSIFNAKKINKKEINKNG